MYLDNLFTFFKNRNINAKKVSDDTGISTGNISEWKKGRSFPSGQKLVTLSNYFNCYIDNLMGREIPKKISIAICIDISNSTEHIVIGYPKDINTALINNKYVNIKDYKMPLGTFCNSLNALEKLIHQYKLFSYLDELSNIIKNGVGRQNADDIILHLENIKTSNIACIFIIRKIIDYFNWNIKISNNQLKEYDFYSKNYNETIKNIINSFISNQSTDLFKTNDTIMLKQNSKWLCYYVLCDENIQAFIVMYKEIVALIDAK